MAGGDRNRRPSGLTTRRSEDVISADIRGSVALELTELKRRMKVWRDEFGDIHLDIKLEAEGNIEGHILEVHRDVMEQSFIREVEGAVNRYGGAVQSGYEQDAACIRRGYMGHRGLYKEISPGYMDDVAITGLRSLPG